MKITLLCQDIEIVKISGESYKDLFLDGECKDNWGMAIYSQMRIAIKKNIHSFQSLLHELSHFWLDLIGCNQIEVFNKEQLADITSNMIKQLILENGSDIFALLKKFAEE